MARLVIKGCDRLGAVEFLEIDRNGHMFVFAGDIPVSFGTAAAFVARYSPAGVLEGIYELPLSNVPLSRRFVTVSSDGDVYFLRTQSSGAEVLGVGFRPLSRGKVIDVRVGGSAAPSPISAHGPITAVRPLTRQQVIETAFALRVSSGKSTRLPMAATPTTCAPALQVVFDVHSICMASWGSRSAVFPIVGVVSARLTKFAARSSTECSPAIYAPTMLLDPTSPGSIVQLLSAPPGVWRTSLPQVQSRQSRSR